MNPSDSSLQLSEADNALQTQCNRNPLSKALLLMHMAGQAVMSRTHMGTEYQEQLLQVNNVTQVSHACSWCHMCVTLFHGVTHSVLVSKKCHILILDVTKVSHTRY